MTQSHWRRSSRSATSDLCVEVAGPCSHGGVQVRDSKDPDGPQLRFDARSWRDFLAEVRSGRLDH